MATNPTIQFKRKTSASGAPGTLLSGEPAFNTVDNFLYVGNTSAVKWVGAEILNSGTTAFTSDTTLATRKAIGDNFLLQTSTTSLTLNSGAQLRFTETGGGTDYIALKAPGVVSTGNVIYTLPGAYPGSSGYVLQADTSGNLSWSAPSSSANVSITATSASSSYNLIFTDASATNTSASLWMDIGQNIQYNPNTDLLTLGGDIAVNGGDITSTATTFNLLNTTVTGLNLGGAAATINLGATATGMQMTLGGAMNIVTDAASNTSSISNVTNVSSYARTASYPYLQLSGSQSSGASSGDSAFVRIQGSGSGTGQPNYVYMLPNTSVTGNVEIGGSISGNVLKIRGTAGGVTNLIGDVTTGTVNLFNGVTTGLVNIANGGASTIEIGGTLRSAQTTVNVFNTTTTGINAFGAADTIVMGSANGTATIRNAGTNINGTLTVTGASVHQGAGSFNSSLTVTGVTTLQGTMSVSTTISSGSTTFNLLNTTVTNANVLGAADTIVMGSANGTATIRNAATNINGNLTVTGATTLQGTMSVSTTISSGSTTFNLLNTTVTNANVLGAAQRWGIGAAGNTSVAVIRNNSLQLGNSTSGNSAIYTHDVVGGTFVGSQPLTIKPDGALIFSTYATFGSGGTTPSVILTATDNATGQTQVAGGDLFLGSKTDAISASSGVNLTFGYSTATINTTSTGTTANVFNTNVTTANAFGAATTLSLANVATGNQATHFASAATISGSTKTLNIGNSGITGSTTLINIGVSSFGVSNVNLGSTTSGTVTVNNAAVVTGPLSVNGGTITSSSTTFNLLNTTVTSLNLAGAADTIVMGSANGTATIRNAGVNINGTLTVTGNSTFQSNILANGGTITSTATTFNLLNTTVTNANVLGAANTINLGSSVATINLGTGTTGANVYVKGNLFVQGATTTISSTTVSIADLNVVLADGQSTTAGVNGAGITLGSTGITWQYNNTGNNWESTENINIASGKTFKINNSTVLSSSALGSSITSASGLVQVGTIGLGTWQGTTIGVAYGGTGLTTYTTGAIVYATAATTLANLAPVSTSGAVLSSTGLNSNPEYKTITLSYGTVTSASNSLSLTIQNAAADGTTKGVATFNSTQFDDASGVITLDTIDGGTYA